MQLNVSLIFPVLAFLLIVPLNFGAAMGLDSSVKEEKSNWFYGKLARVELGCPMSLEDTFIAPVTLWAHSDPNIVKGYFCQLVTQQVTLGGGKIGGIKFDTKFENISGKTCGLLASNLIESGEISVLEEGEEEPKLMFTLAEFLSSTPKKTMRKFYRHQKVNLILDNWTFDIKVENFGRICNPKDEVCKSSGVVVWDYTEADNAAKMTPVNENYCYIRPDGILCPKSPFAIIPIDSTNPCYHSYGNVKIQVENTQAISDRTKTMEYNPNEVLEKLETNFDQLFNQIKNSSGRVLIKVVAIPGPNMVAREGLKLKTE